MANVKMLFASDALAEDALQLRRMEGREAISALYEFKLVVQPEDEGFLSPETIDKMLTARATLSFDDMQEKRVFGVLREVELMPAGDPPMPVYRVVLVPRLWHATQTVRSRIFLDKTIPEIATSLLEEVGLSSPSDFRLALSSDYGKREYTMQYQESDFAFLCRLLEHEGISFFFEQGDEGERVVLGDTNTVFPAIAPLPFAPTLDDAQPEAVRSIHAIRRAMPKEVRLIDYDHRLPKLDPNASADVDAKGRGVRILHDDHFRDQATGDRLATVRAQEIAVGRDTFRGLSNVRALSAGARFTLEDHAHDALNTTYLVTELRHAVVQEAVEAAAGGNRAYENTIVAIPAQVAFRPARETPWPSIHGVTYATVTGVPGAPAPIDERGRYKVKVPFDSVERGEAESASCWIRMAQPSSGANYGTHLPLHPGAEVLLAHVDGDPDRPIIVGAVPNGLTPSPVAARNATKSSMKTQGGIHIEMDDALAEGA